MDTVIGIVVIALIVWAVVAAKSKPQHRVILLPARHQGTGCGLLIAAGLLVLALAGAALACF